MRNNRAMRSILLAETSQTRRRALTVRLTQRGFAVTALAGLDEAYATLMRMASGAARYDGVVLGWPDHVDGLIEDVFDLLHGSRFEHLPVLVLSDGSSDGAINWRMIRPRTALLQWNDYHEVGAALEQLLDPLPRQSVKPLETHESAPLRLLLVDDSATVRAAFAKLLRGGGFTVETANNCNEGLQKALAQSFDIAVIDYYMPDSNGTVLIRALKADSRTEHMLISAITGTYSDAVIQDALAAGAIECLFKSEAKELFTARLTSLARTVRDRKAIETERRRLECILQSVGDGVYVVDSDARIRLINPAALELLGHESASAAIGADAFDLIHPLQQDGSNQLRSACPLLQAYSRGNRITGWQTCFSAANGHMLPVECTVYPLRVDEQRSGSVVAFRDISARRVMEEELRRAAEHDALTGLHNRAWFERQIEQELARLRRSNLTSLLLFMDVDRFKYINDTAGHGAGDQLLVEVSKRLKLRLRSSDHLARMGGDEFALILRNVDVENLQALADGFRRALTNSPFTYAGKSYRITTSIGVCRLDQRSLTPTEAMAHADIALHLAKNAGRNRTQLYTQETGERAAMDRDLGWSSRLEEALRNDHFVLAYQPIVPLGGIFGDALTPDSTDLWRRQLARNPESPALFEVLIRMRDQHGELILPGAFLPTAERFGMMREVDRWVVDHALRALREVSDAPRPVHLTINLHSQSLSDMTLAEYVTGKIVEHNVDASCLVFEITESHAIDDLAGAQRILHDLREIGCRIAVDDFGTGFSTFAYLRQLEADIVKLDGSLIAGLPDDPLDRTIVAALVSIAEAAGKIVVAECVENPAVLIALHECGVDLAQGNAVGLPRLHLRPTGPISVPSLRDISEDLPPTTSLISQLRRRSADAS